MQQPSTQYVVGSMQYLVCFLLVKMHTRYYILPTTYYLLGTTYYLLHTTYQATTYQITQNSTTLIMSLFNPKKHILLFCILSTMELQKRYTRLLQKNVLCCYIFQLSTHTQYTCVVVQLHVDKLEKTFSPSQGQKPSKKAESICVYMNIIICAFKVKIIYIFILCIFMDSYTSAVREPRYLDNIQVDFYLPRYYQPG